VFIYLFFQYFFFKSKHVIFYQLKQAKKSKSIGPHDLMHTWRQKNTINYFVFIFSVKYIFSFFWPNKVFQL